MPILYILTPVERLLKTTHTQNNSGFAIRIIFKVDKATSRPQPLCETMTLIRCIVLELCTDKQTDAITIPSPSIMGHRDCCSISVCTAAVRKPHQIYARQIKTLPCRQGRDATNSIVSMVDFFKSSRTLESCKNCIIMQLD